MDTTYRKNLKAVLTASKNYTDNSIEKLKWELGTYDLSITTDSTVAYTKTIPTNAIKGRLNYIGGASKVSENLIVLNDVAETTVNGITYSATNGIYKLNGTATANGSIYKAIPLKLKAGTYILNSFNTNARTYISIGGTDYNAGTSFTLSSDFNGNAYYNIYFTNGTTFSNQEFKPMLVKGSTAPTEFSEGFENIRSAKTTSVVVSGTDVSPITKAIPSEIQALEGYGLGLDDTTYNYVDLINKKFVQKVGRVDLGSLTWILSGAGDNARFITLGIGSLILKGTTNLLCTKYTAVSWDNLVNSNNDMIMASRASDGYLGIRNLAYTDATTFKTATSGVYLYYELATPIETDISQYIDDEFKNIDITDMTTITFENEFGYDVPSEIDYLIEEVKA